MSIEKNKNSDKKMSKGKKSKLDPSSLEASFLERPLPESDDVSRFDDLVKREAILKDTDNNLSAIYSDNRGEPVDVSKVKKRKRIPLIVFFKRVFVLTIIACAIYGAYFFYFQNSNSEDGLLFYINAPEKVVAGEIMSYEIIYENNSDLTLNNVTVELVLPDSFVLTESDPVLDTFKKWKIDTINPKEKSVLKLNGYLVSALDSANIINARFTYTPSNFSSEFKKEASANTVISGLGFLLNLDYINTALVEKNNELKLNFSAFQNNNLQNVYLEITGSDNLQINKTTSSDSKQDDNTSSSEEVADDKKVIIEKTGDFLWSITNLPLESSERVSVPLDFSFKEKKDEKEDISFKLFQKDENNKEFIFWEKTLSFDLVSSDLNIELSLNDNKSDQAIDFGSELNYSLSYANNGEAVLYNVVLMAVVKGQFIDWSSLKDPLGGSVAGNAIVWTKEDLPILAELAPGESGEIKFSLNLNDFSLNDMSADNEIISYAQYGLNTPLENDSEDNRSNTIHSQLNSDLSLSEKIVYFNDDNLPVGSGPLPPRVGEKTSVRVMWTIKNNLHDLEDTEVLMSLPAGINWESDSNTNVGRIFYDEDSRVVTWRLGYLPLSVYRADAEFSISLTPKESDRDKILILSPGSIVKATDIITKSEISRKGQAKTTKLEDDEIAGLSNNGRVE